MEFHLKDDIEEIAEQEGFEIETMSSADLETAYEEIANEMKEKKSEYQTQMSNSLEIAAKTILNF